MHAWGEMLWVAPLTRRGTAKRQVNQLHTAVLLGLCLTLANYLFFGFPPPTSDLP